MDHPDQRSSGWHVGKEIPIGVIFAIIVQSSILVWGASKFDSRLSEMERIIPKMVETTESNRAWQIEQRTRLWNRMNEIESIVQGMKASMSSIEANIQNINRNLDRVLDSLWKDREEKEKRR